MHEYPGLHEVSANRLYGFEWFNLQKFLFDLP